jgi:tetratricopeptide (TPR) repeat protein
MARQPDRILEEAKAAFRKMLPPEWVTRDRSPEQPQDMEVEMTEAEGGSAGTFIVHLEVVKKVRRKRGGVSREIGTDILKGYENSPAPVLLLHWTRSSGEFRCIFAQRYLQKTLSMETPDWRKKQKQAISYPSDSELKDLVEVRSIVTNALFYLLDQILNTKPEACSPQYWLGDIPVSTDEELKRRTIRALTSLRDYDYGQGTDELEKMLRGCVFAPVEKMSVLVSLGNAHFSRGDYREATKNYTGALELADRIEEDTEEGRSVALANMGLACLETGDSERALTYLQDAMTIQREIECKSREASALGAIAMASRARSDLDKALRFCQHASRVAAETLSKQAEANQLCNLGLIYSDKGELETALDHLRQALEIDREIGYKEGEAHHLAGAGLIHKGAGDLDSALKHLQDALEIAASIGNKQALSNYSGTIGLLHRAKGDLDEAVSCFKNELGLSKEMGYKRGEVSALGNIGLVHDARGNLDEALRNLEEALRLSRSIGYREGEANQLGNIGLIYFDKGKLEDALDYLGKALTIHREVGYRQGEASGLGNIGLVYEAKGDRDNALKYLEEALSVLVEYDLEHGKEIIENAIRELQQQKNDMD